MACSTCATANSSGALHDWHGSLESGAEQTFIYSTKTLPVYSVRAPNILVFSDNPFVAVGDKIILRNTHLAKKAGVNVKECQTVTTAAVLVDGRYEVATDDAIVSLTGSPTVVFSATAGAGTVFGNCGTNAAATTEKFEALFCNGTAAANNFSGYIYTSPPNTDAKGVLLIISSGSPDVTVKARTGVSIKKGDKIELLNTALVGSNFAIVSRVIDGRDNDNQKVTRLVLNKPVTGITQAAAGGVICVDAIITKVAIAPISFGVECGCAVTAKVPASITSSESFPRGENFEGSTCGQSKYCYVIVDKTPGSEKPYTMGSLVL